MQVLIPQHTDLLPDVFILVLQLLSHHLYLALYLANSMIQLVCSSTHELQ